MKVVIQQLKCKGYINLLPIVNGIHLYNKMYSVYPSYYSIIDIITSGLKAEFK